MHMVIWGTDVNIVETKKHFQQFLRQYINDLDTVAADDEMPDGNVIEPYYLQCLEEVSSINIM